MRLWYVPLEDLDDRRVIAQHHEIHMLMGLFSYHKRKNWAGIDYEHHMGCIYDYHLTAVQEMRIRGYNGHATPLAWSDEFGEPGCGSWLAHVDAMITPMQVRQDILDLAVRWEKEGYIPTTERQQAMANYARALHA